MWQKVFTEDCDNDSKATSKFWVSASEPNKKKYFEKKNAKRNPSCTQNEKISIEQKG